MDEYRENVQKVQKALNQDAAFIQPNPYLAQRVLNAAKTQEGDGGSMKHKLSFSMMLVVVLLSLSLAAGAVAVINSFVERAALLQNEKGDMSHWTLEEKMNLIVSMQESGIDIPQEQLELLTAGGLSTEEANRIADQLLIEKKHAREALEQQYGFTRTTFAFFTTQVDFVEDANLPEDACWQVTYTPVSCAERIGFYQVRLHALTGEILSVSWQFDGETKADDGLKGWHTAVWDAALVDRLASFEQEMQEKKAALELTRGAFEAWTLAEKAAFDQVYLDWGYPESDLTLNVLPSQGDLTAEEAVAYALEQIESSYGVNPSDLQAFRVEQSLFQLPDAGEKLYIVEFHHATATESYAVEFTAASGEVQLCAHYVNQVFVAPHSDNGTAAENAVQTDISEGEMASVREALKAAYGLTEDALRFFDAVATPRAEGWLVTFTSNTINPAKVGDYTVAYSQTQQCVCSVEWEYDAVYPTQEKQTYWKENDIWGPYEMNCFALFRNATREIIKEAGGENHLSFEQRAEYDGLYREAGYDRTRYYHGTPGVLDIALTDALSRAKAAVAERWHELPDRLESCEVRYEFDVSDPDQYVWRIRLLLDNGDRMYTVELDSETGDILNKYVGSGSNG